MHQIYEFIEPCEDAGYRNVTAKRGRVVAIPPRWSVKWSLKCLNKDKKNLHCIPVLD